ncbi:MAG: MBL fold metallo-hydrolase [Candidatus Sumerlaeia bacterium]|nr:MBL fold metallo-hydrolase [Candidatus Sumerlaeia bacterium]
MNHQRGFRGTLASRREFLKLGAASAAALTFAGRLNAAKKEKAAGLEVAKDGAVAQLSDHFYVYQGPINVGILRDGDKALLIDCGDGSVASVLSRLGIKSVAQVVFTHHHRDQACGAGRLLSAATKTGVPAAERAYFENPAAYWNNDNNLWKVFASFRPHRLMLTEPLRVDEAYTDGQRFAFGPATIEVLHTPGHTDGAVSYVIEVDERRVVFCGDCIYDDGQIWDIWSLQKGFAKGTAKIGAYHGFMGDRWTLLESLERIRQRNPSLLIPSHGRIIRRPDEAIGALAKRFEACYENYVAISALRYYFPALFADYAGRPGQMPIRPGFAPPECLRHIGTTWMLVSKTGAAFVMDVGSNNIVRQIQKMLDGGEIKSVDALWVTHYHHDHTEGIPLFQKTFDCPCITDRRLAEVLTNPTAWRLPCLISEPVRVEKLMEDGQSWQWHEFKMTSYYYPGQTLYHAALLAEGEGHRMFFIGDSHTPSGIDDYCAQNRNFLGRGVGFQYCLSLMEKLRPTHVFNPHVKEAFTFTDEEIGFMRKNLVERERLFNELVPWDHPNYATDESWVRCFPYTQKAKPGDQIRLEVVITNHSATAREMQCRAVLPKSFGGQPTEWAKASIPPKAEKFLRMELQVPETVPAQRHIIPIDVVYGLWRLPQIAEAIVDVVG